MKTIDIETDIGWWGISSAAIKKQLPSDGSPVQVNINSYGGSVYEGYRIYNLLRDYDGEVTIIIDILAASIASYISMAASPGKLGVRENSTFMAHKAWGISIGDSDDLALESQILSEMDILIADSYAKRTGQNRDDLLSAMKNEIWLIGGQNIVNAGFADFILEKNETETQETSEQNQKDEVLIKVEVQNKIREIKSEAQKLEKSEDLEKFVAVLKDKSHVNLQETAPTNQQNETPVNKEMSVDTPVENKEPIPNRKNKGDDKNMSQEDYEKGVQKEQERVNKILEYQAEHPDCSQEIFFNAIKNNKTPEECLASIMAYYASPQGKAKSDSPENLTTTPDEKSPENTVSGDKSPVKGESGSDKAARLRGKNKGGKDGRQ